MDELLPLDALEDVSRTYREEPRRALDCCSRRCMLEDVSPTYREEPDHPPLPKHTQEFTTHYMVASRCAFMMLDAPELARLGRLHELIQGRVHARGSADEPGLRLICDPEHRRAPALARVGARVLKFGYGLKLPGSRLGCSPLIRSVPALTLRPNSYATNARRAGSTVSARRLDTWRTNSYATNLDASHLSPLG